MRKDGMKLKSLLRTRLRNVRLGALGLLLSTTACAAAIVDPAAPASEPTDASGREVARSADGASGQTVQAQSSATLAANAMQGEEPQIRSQSRVDVPQAGPTGGQQSGSRDNIFWLFSSSAQAISAFIAFLVTGYIFALTAMEGLEKADETLAEIHFELKKEYHSRLTALSVLTGCAIISSLTAVYANGFEFAYRGVLFCATAAVDLGAIIGGLLFVTSIVNPERYKKAAKAQIVAILVWRAIIRLSPTVIWGTSSPCWKVRPTPSAATRCGARPSSERPR